MTLILINPINNKYDYGDLTRKKLMSERDYGGSSVYVYGGRVLCWG